MNAIISDKRILGQNIAAITITTKNDWGWVPGQYIKLKTNEYEARPYSIAASGKTADVFDIHVAASGYGQLSDYLVHQADIGSDIIISGPFGGMSFPLKTGRTVVFIAGGTGLAPVNAYIQCMECDTYSLYHAVRGEAEFYAPKLGLTATAIFSEQKKTGVLYGFPHDVIDFRNHLDAVFYLAGPPQMVQACVQVLHQHGVKSDAIFHD